ncbi:MAG: RNA degradosome polyphosphate kinase [Micrococcaceae bacterium]
MAVKKKNKQKLDTKKDHVSIPMKLDKPELEGDFGLDRFLEREMSWLAFNKRVLELAEDETLPLLERANFLAIFASNLDEFFMVRVAGLKRRIATGIAVPAANGEAPEVIYENILTTAHELQKRHAAVFREDIHPKMTAEGIQLVTWDELNKTDQKKLKDYFNTKLFPVLTPLAVDPAHPFPYISGLSLNMAILLRNPATGTRRFARLKVPTEISRIIPVDDPGQPTKDKPRRYMTMEDVIAHHLDVLFPGMEVVEKHIFRVTRNEDVSVEEDDAENLLKALEKELLRRKFGPPVRLEVPDSISEDVLEYLVLELEMDDREVFKLPAPVDLRGLTELTSINRPDLHYPPRVPHTNRLLNETETSQAANIFSAMRNRDVLLHHPYDAFSTSVQAFLEQAAADPNVQAIKQTLYRTSGDSPIVNSLIKAAQSGKQVLAIVEIKARFDEEANISWARKLERAGVHVVYGIVGLKTHCKLSLVVRQEKEGLRSYAHVGTGNYHPKTARFYEDLGILTCDPVVTDDMAKLFNQLSGYAPESHYNRFLVAPGTLRSGLVKLMEQETKNAKAGKKASIKIKVNSIVDETIIDSLYRASQAGVKVEVVVRGICAIRPGVSGLSENIKVRSILGRYLEHSRIFRFHNNGKAITYIGSSDMMHRNLDRRVETIVKIKEEYQQNYIEDLLNLYLSDETSSWALGEDGNWSRQYQDNDGNPLVDAQTYIADMIETARKESLR